jgi:hypothetical protein
MPSIINSDDGVVSGTSGLKTTGGNDGILALQNNGTTNVTVTAAGNVGIGTASPSGRLSTAVPDGVTNALYAERTGGSPVQLSVTFANQYSNLISSQVLSLHAGSVERGRFDTSGNFLFNSGYGSVATAYGCRAWVNFNGTSTVAIRASGNVTSITDNGTGDYTANFTSAMPDANYCVAGTAGVGATTAFNSVIVGTGTAAHLAAGSVRFTTKNLSGPNINDVDQIQLAIFR